MLRVDHSMDVARKAEKGLEAAEKARAKANKKLKETFTRLSKVEKAQRNVESALQGYERQAADALEAQRKAEKAQAEQVAYDASMTKTAESLTAQLYDVARAFCLEVWGQALNAAKVDIESELRTPDKVDQPLALRLAPILLQPPTVLNPILPSSSEQKDPVPSPTSSKGKETTKELPPPDVVVDVKVEKEMAEGVPLKRKKKDREQVKKGAKENEPKSQLSPYLGNAKSILQWAVVHIVPLLLLFCTTVFISLMKKSLKLFLFACYLLLQLLLLLLLLLLCVCVCVFFLLVHFLFIMRMSSYALVTFLSL